MTADNDRSLETTPLLPKATEVHPESGDAPEEILPSTTEPNNHTNGSTKSQDEERQDDEGDREVQFKGMPDVRNRLKYILPALAIGVCVLTASMWSVYG